MDLDTRFRRATRAWQLAQLGTQLATHARRARVRCVVGNILQPRTGDHKLPLQVECAARTNVGTNVASLVQYMAV